MILRIDEPCTILPLGEPGPEPERGIIAPVMFFALLAVIGILMMGSVL